MSYGCQREGNSKIDHIKDMLANIAYSKEKQKLFQSIAYVLMDTWYATTDMMMLIDKRHTTKHITAQ